MFIELILDEGYEIGWNYFEHEPLDDEDVIHFERLKSRLIYDKGVLVSKKPGLDKRGRLFSKRSTRR